MSEPTILNVSNNAQTQLSAGINNSVTTIPVVPTTLFPTSFPFNISVGNEIMQVTAATGSPVTAFTVATRGTIEGTSANAHAEDTVVQLRWTAGAYYSLVDYLEWLKDTEVGSQIATHTVAVDPTSTNTTRNKHLSNNDLKGVKDHADTVTGNPHAVTKAEVGLGNVTNHEQAKKSDYDTHVGTGNIHFLASSVTKTDVGLSNVTNHEQAKKSDYDTHVGHVSGTNNVHGLGEDTVKIGAGATASGTNSVAIGKDSDGAAEDSIAIGRGARIVETTAERSIAMGDNAKASQHEGGSDAVAIGTDSIADGEGSLALGIATHAEGFDSVCLGAAARTSNTHEYSVALGAGAVTSEADQVMLGRKEVSLAVRANDSDGTVKTGYTGNVTEGGTTFEIVKGLIVGIS